MKCNKWRQNNYVHTFLGCFNLYTELRLSAIRGSDTTLAAHIVYWEVICKFNSWQFWLVLSLPAQFPSNGIHGGAAEFRLPFALQRMEWYPDPPDRAVPGTSCLLCETGKARFWIRNRVLPNLLLNYFKKIQDGHDKNLDLTLSTLSGVVQGSNGFIAKNWAARLEK